MSVIVRVNGRSVGEGAAISALDHGFLYANGLFETMRALGGRPFALERHLRRMSESGGVIGLPIPAEDLLAREVAAALEEAGEEDAYVRLTVTRGVGAPGPDPATCGEPTVTVVVKPFPAPPARWLREGIRTVTSSLRRNDCSPLVRVKSTNYLECILGKQEARRQGADEAIFLDTRGLLAEATAWNVFFIDGGRLLTPDERGAILPGVTRAIVLELAAAQRIACERGAYPPEQLVSAQEAFLTNSLYGVAPLGSVDGTAIGDGAPGPVTHALAAGYEALLERHRRGGP